MTNDDVVFSHSDSINEIVAAISKVQGQLPNAKKIKDNPHFKSKYADLAELRDISREPLSAAGLAVIQSPSSNGLKVSLTTLIAHSSGQWIKGLFTVTSAKDTPQAAGSCVTYLRRYSLESMLFIVAEGVDDDGNLGTDLREKKDDRSSAGEPKQRNPNSQPSKVDNRQTAHQGPPKFDPTNAKCAAWLDKALAHRGITEPTVMAQASELMSGEAISAEALDAVLTTISEQANGPSIEDLF